VPVLRHHLKPRKTAETSLITIRNRISSNSAVCSLRAEEDETNDRLLAVAIHSYQHLDLSTIDDLNPSILVQVEQSSFPTTSFGAKSQAGDQGGEEVITRRTSRQPLSSSPQT
jgi:hypothetical protein